jgi:hypothetical protein
MLSMHARTRARAHTHTHTHSDSNNDHKLLSALKDLKAWRGTMHEEEALYRSIKMKEKQMRGGAPSNHVQGVSCEAAECGVRIRVCTHVYMRVFMREAKSFKLSPPGYHLLHHTRP